MSITVASAAEGADKPHNIIVLVRWNSQNDHVGRPAPDRGVIDVETTSLQQFPQHRAAKENSEDTTGPHKV